jgi:hypothetical protein
VEDSVGEVCRTSADVVEDGGGAEDRSGAGGVTVDRRIEAERRTAAERKTTAEQGRLQTTKPRRDLGGQDSSASY